MKKGDIIYEVIFSKMPEVYIHECEVLEVCEDGYTVKNEEGLTFFMHSTILEAGEYTSGRTPLETVEHSISWIEKASSGCKLDEVFVEFLEKLTELKKTLNRATTGFEVLCIQATDMFLQEAKRQAGNPVDVDNNPDIPSRLKSLASCRPGSGHDCFMKGVPVMVSVTAMANEWQQMQRYHWFDIVSSQSKMYSMTKFDLEKKCTKEVDPRIVEIAKEYVEKYNNEECTLEELFANVPLGLTLRACVITNYLQLKTMYHQRRTHRLEIWHTKFMNMLSELPEFMGLVKKD